MNSAADTTLAKPALKNVAGAALAQVIVSCLERSFNLDRLNGRLRGRGGEGEEAGENDCELHVGVLGGINWED